ncbi:MAG: NAD(P)H-hydrate dehydratase [Chloroflexi bacterium]|nr:NAD(P)H-hydrate dehydratase [Chloroflexota bacterium]
MAIKVANISEMRAIEEAADRSGISYEQMMIDAGRAASAYLQSRLMISKASVIVFLVGKGNNGGDGLVMALDLASKTAADIRLYLVEMRGARDTHFRAAVDAGIVYAVAADDAEGSILTDWIGKASAVVDALFGIGLRLPLSGRVAALIEQVSTRLNITDRSASGANKIEHVSGVVIGGGRRPFVLALDCPSGVDCDSGDVDPCTISADATVTFIAAKPGLLTFPAAGKVGDLVVAPLGIPSTLRELERVSTSLADGELAASLLPPRPLDGHKGTFGKALLVAGSQNYIGAVALASEAACRSGIGLATVATSPELIGIVSSRLREPTWLPLRADSGAISERASDKVVAAARTYDALLMGCGLGLHESTQAFIRKVVTAAELPPLILDADALNALSQQPEWWQFFPAGTVITPHSGEMSRLTGLSTAEINSDRWNISRQYAARWNVVVVLKGAHTIVAEPEGEASVIPFKTDALGTAGTGDILAGLITGLRAQRLSAFDSARLGAYVHALAGMIAVDSVGSSRSVIAGDVLAALGTAFMRIESA